MNILVADDHPTNRRLLTELLSAEGFTVTEARDGHETLAALRASAGPLVALIDWQMPGRTGVDVCREFRRDADASRVFIVLVTVRDSPADVVAGLEAGANDYVTKPFDNAELLARVRIGAQMLALQEALGRRVQELERAMAEIKQLSGLLPICSYCKKIRDDRNYWQQVETYLAAHTDARFSHGVCPQCFDAKVRPQLSGIGIPDAEIDEMRSATSGKK